jgi:hypothetical protein
MEYNISVDGYALLFASLPLALEIGNYLFQAFDLELKRHFGLDEAAHLSLHIALIIHPVALSQLEFFLLDVYPSVLLCFHPAGLLVETLDLKVGNVLLELALVGDGGEIILDIAL